MVGYNFQALHFTCTTRSLSSWRSAASTAIKQFMRDNAEQLERDDAYVFPALYCLIKVVVEEGVTRVALRDKYASPRHAVPDEFVTTPITEENPRWTHELLDDLACGAGLCIASSLSGKCLATAKVCSSPSAVVDLFNPRDLRNKRDGLKYLTFVTSTPWLLPTTYSIQEALANSRSFVNVRKYVYYNEVGDPNYNVFLALDAEAKCEVLRCWWQRQHIQPPIQV